MRHLNNNMTKTSSNTHTLQKLSTLVGCNHSVDYMAPALTFSFKLLSLISTYTEDSKSAL